MLVGFVGMRGLYRWNKLLLETLDVGCGMIPVYRDRISVIYPKAITNTTDDESNVSIQAFSNAEAPPFPQKLKKRPEVCVRCCSVSALTTISCVFHSNAVSLIQKK